MIDNFNLEDINRLFYAELGPIGIISFGYTPDEFMTGTSSVIITWALPDKKVYTQAFDKNLFNKYLMLNVTEIVNEFIKPTCEKFKLKRNMDKENK